MRNCTACTLLVRGVIRKLRVGQECGVVTSNDDVISISYLCWSQDIYVNLWSMGVLPPLIKGVGMGWLNEFAHLRWYATLLDNIKVDKNTISFLHCTSLSKYDQHFTIFKLFNIY